MREYCLQAREGYECPALLGGAFPLGSIKLIEFYFLLRVYCIITSVPIVMTLLRVLLSSDTSATTFPASALAMI